MARSRQSHRRLLRGQLSGCDLEPDRYRGASRARWGACCGSELVRSDSASVIPGVVAARAPGRGGQCEPEDSFGRERGHSEHNPWCPGPDRRYERCRQRQRGCEGTSARLAGSSGDDIARTSASTDSAAGGRGPGGAACGGPGAAACGGPAAAAGGAASAAGVGPGWLTRSGLRARSPVSLWACPSCGTGLRVNAPFAAANPSAREL
jgi:hypothetical protein